MNEDTEPQQDEQEQQEKPPAPRHYTIKCLPGIFRTEQHPPGEEANPGEEADQPTKE